MKFLPFFGHDNGSGTKPPDTKGRSKLLSSSAAMGGRHRLSKLSTLLILSMSASAAAHDVVVVQQHPKRPDLLEEAKLFETKAGTQIRKTDSDGRQMMTVSLHMFVMECIVA